MFLTILVFDFPEDSIQLPENAKYLQSDLTAGTCLSYKLIFSQPQLCIVSYRMSSHKA